MKFETQHQNVSETPGLEVYSSSRREIRLMVLCDNAGSADRIRRSDEHVLVRLYEIKPGNVLLANQARYRSKAPTERSQAVLKILAGLPDDNDLLLVAGYRFGRARWFLQLIKEACVDFVVEVAPSVISRETNQVLNHAEITWRPTRVQLPQSERQLELQVADLGLGRAGPIQFFGYRSHVNEVRICMTNMSGVSAAELLACVVWGRQVHRQVRQTSAPRPARRPRIFARSHDANDGLKVRPSIQIGVAQDEKNSGECFSQASRLRGVMVTPRHDRLSVVDLFAGAGGMGLGFLLAKPRGARYSVRSVADINVHCVRTLQANYHRLLQMNQFCGRVPAQIVPVDLNARHFQRGILDSVTQKERLDVLVGGPPCQGFSMANRNSWDPDNPNNFLVSTFLRYLRRLSPRIFIMENVQGMLWTAGAGDRAKNSMADFVFRTARSSGYIVFAKLIDGAWYGVPQHRTRLFVIGLHRDLGYRESDFGDWGPFPRPTHGPLGRRPFVTVAEAISDLPGVGNGHDEERTPYDEPSQLSSFLRYVRSWSPRTFVWDHVVSRQSEYVLERYRVVPEGGNWKDIAHLLTNYAGINRTHSNIYRRLRWDSPSVTLGHYRKSMLIHPTQNRGLSLREAARLQGFPDWFRFLADSRGSRGGLDKKQQQLANAVSPIITKALADFIARL